MNHEIVKGKPLTKQETKFLLDLIEDNNIITKKITNANNNKLKTKAWVRVTDQFNATVSNYRRTPQQLRLKWENLKKNARKRSHKIRENQNKTAGEHLEYIPPDDILDRVSSLLGTETGNTVSFEGDQETGSVDDDVGMEGESSGDEGILPITPIPIYNIKTEVVKSEIHVLDDVDENVINVPPPVTRRIPFNTPRAEKKKVKVNDTRTRDARNLEIANYFKAKREFLEVKTKHESENYKLRNEELALKIQLLKMQLVHKLNDSM